jgi:hypothetical protein
LNGADDLVHTLLAGGVEVCFTNPGTSEMHFVAALDRIDRMRCVLGLFEGVVTGAADGYYRIAGKPAATLLHLGPGLGNGLANLHNARRARSGIVNIVGDHATDHLANDSPLSSCRLPLGSHHPLGTHAACRCTGGDRGRRHAPGSDCYACAPGRCRLGRTACWPGTACARFDATRLGLSSV